MPDNTPPVEAEDEILINGEAITEEEVKEKLKGLIHTDKFTISVGEKRPIRQYEMNSYLETVSLEISGLSPFLDSLTVGPTTRRRLSSLALGMLTGRSLAMYNFMKASMHQQQELDGIPTIDFREGEKGPVDDE